jgi:hypothetical protein
MMTTRAYLANGGTFDYDEETEAHPTHVDGQAVLRREYSGPTPPKPAKQAGETREQAKDRLRAELKALDEQDDEEAVASGQ